MHPREGRALRRACKHAPYRSSFWSTQRQPDGHLGLFPVVPGVVRDQLQADRAQRPLGDALEQAAYALAEMYAARLTILSKAAVLATGKVAAIRQARFELAQSRPKSSSVLPWLILAAAIGAGAYAWRQAK